MITDGVFPGRLIPFSVCLIREVELSCLQIVSGRGTIIFSSSARQVDGRVDVEGPEPLHGYRQNHRPAPGRRRTAPPAPFPREDGACFRRGRGFRCPLHLVNVCPALPVGTRSRHCIHSFFDFRPAMGPFAGTRNGSHSRHGSISLVVARGAFDRPLRRDQEAPEILVARTSVCGF